MNYVKVFIVWVSVIVLGFIALSIVAINQPDEYNNGICPECGGKYEYDTAVGHKRFTTYIYKCEECDKIVELTYIP